MNFPLACFDFVRTQKRIQSHHLTPFWIDFSLFIMCYRTILFRHEKLSLMCEIYGGPKSVTAIYSQQFQFVHGNFNLLKAISICSQQFQFAHRNFNLLTAISIFSRQCSQHFSLRSLPVNYGRRQ